MNLHFVVGTGRCGSSLIHEILAMHDRVSFVSNVDDNFPRLRLKGRFNSELYRLTGGAMTRKGSVRFAPSEAYSLISREVSPIYANSCRDLTASDVTPWLRDRFRRFFEARFIAQRKPCLLHKYTGWSRIGFLASIFPEAKFVHVVRDGRAVANSWLQMEWWGGYRGPENWLWGLLREEEEGEWARSGQSFVALAGLAWKILMESYERSRQHLASNRYMEVRYEDFVDNPKDVLRAIAEFVDLPWSSSLDRALAVQKVSSARSRAFERDLTNDQQIELESCLRPVLSRYGYV